MILWFGSLALFFFTSSNIMILNINCGLKMTMNNPTSPNGYFSKSPASVHISAKHSGSIRCSKWTNCRFSFYHKEKLPSAAERYVDEIKRVLGVLESQLKKPEKKGYL